MKSQDIFTGGNISVAIGTDLTNTNLNGLGFVDIPSINAFPEISASRNSIKVVDYTSTENRTLVGRRSFADTSIAINYIPGDPTHERMLSIAEGTKRIQMRITYWMDEDKDYGVAFLFNGYLSSDAFSGDAEATVTQTFTIAIDKMVARGILDLTSQGGGVINPLVITKDFPSVINMKEGDAVELEIEVSGGYSPYSYRWYKDGQLTQIGSTVTTLALFDAPVGTHIRKVVVADSMGQTVTSNECTVTVTAA
ncbi:hypothetical protein NGC32_06295 [Kluyvera cryocrescens]|uniref:hypothetical protein n=1 Tax=Kluyvera cryocrescens TaxID=580 RepID=UPI002DBE73FB|nr:hypothetical protein [Kluyvera cryocrescens]MEB7712335.1 hypothetical protein [Kluyvera cryocrescens]